MSAERFTPKAAALILGAATCLFVGCAGKGDVNGTVALNGVPLKGGYVHLINEGEGRNFTGTINEDGTYTIQSVMPGKYKVIVDTESLKPGGQPDAGSGKGSYKLPGGGGDLQKAVESGKLKPGPGPKVNLPEGASQYKDGFATMKGNAGKYVPIPVRYTKAETTDLSVEVSGARTYNIDLKQ